MIGVIVGMVLYFLFSTLFPANEPTQPSPDMLTRIEALETSTSAVTEAEITLETRFAIDRFCSAWWVMERAAGESGINERGKR